VAIGRISGALLFSDLDRQSTDLAFTTNGRPLAYMDFTNFRFGVNTNSVVDTFTVTGTANVSGVTKVFGNLVAASGVQASNVNTGAFNVIGGAGITGNLYAGNLFADNFSGNISNTGGTSIFGNISVIDTAVLGSLNTANAVISGGYISALTNAYITTSLITNFSTANAVISGGYISALTNATIITGNVGSWYATELNSTTANLTSLTVTNLNSGNAVISGGYISSLTNAYVTTSNITNFSTGNAVISGGYISALTNATIITGNVESWYATDLNTTNGNLVTAIVTNLSSGNAVISGGYISTLSNAAITTANLGNIKIENITISSLVGNIVIQPLLTNPNAVVTINSTSALQLPSGTTAQQPAPVYGGAIRWNNTTNNLEVYNGTGWQSLLGQISNQSITPDGSSSIFTLDFNTTAEGIIVSINGTLQQPGVAYTVAGNQITFAEIPLISDIISIRYIASGTVTAENSQEINSGNITLTTGAVLIDSFNINQYRSVKYMASTTADSGAAEFAEFAVTQFDPNVAVSNVNKSVTGSSLATITANISGSIVQVYATASSSAQMRLQKTYFVI
jgi:hypothetical protein